MLKGLPNSCLVFVAILLAREKSTCGGNASRLPSALKPEIRLSDNDLKNLPKKDLVVY